MLFIWDGESMLFEKQNYYVSNSVLSQITDFFKERTVVDSYLSKVYISRSYNKNRSGPFSNSEKDDSYFYWIETSNHGKEINAEQDIKALAMDSLFIHAERDLVTGALKDLCTSFACTMELDDCGFSTINADMYVSFANPASTNVETRFNAATENFNSLLDHLEANIDYFDIDTHIDELVLRLKGDRVCNAHIKKKISFLPEEEEKLSSKVVTFDRDQLVHFYNEVLRTLHRFRNDYRMNDIRKGGVDLHITPIVYEDQLKYAVSSLIWQSKLADIRSEYAPDENQLPLEGFFGRIGEESGICLTLNNLTTVLSNNTDRSSDPRGKVSLTFLPVAINEREEIKPYHRFLKSIILDQLLQTKKMFESYSPVTKAALTISRDLEVSISDCIITSSKEQYTHNFEYNTLEKLKSIVRRTNTKLLLDEIQLCSIRNKFSKNPTLTTKCILISEPLPCQQIITEEIFNQNIFKLSGSIMRHPKANSDIFVKVKNNQKIDHPRIKVSALKKVKSLNGKEKTCVQTYSELESLGS